MADPAVKRVLIIEDNTGMLTMVSRVLRSSGYDVFEAMRAEQALELVFREDFHAVLTDIFMPGIGGIEAIQRIRQIKPTLPIVAMSAGYEGMSGESATQAAVKLGAVAIVEKPIKPQQLLNAILKATGGAADGARETP